MTLNHISIFLPNDSSFYCRLFNYLKESFERAGIKISGCCKLLSESEMHLWLRQYKPDIIFEMNRVKDDIPILHDLGIPHITWIVDFQGRTENHIKGSDITYFFDPGWDENYKVGGLQDWLPPGTCIKTFFPDQLKPDFETEFNFMGHIPKPWSFEELNRKVDPESEVTFETLLKCYDNHMEATKFEIKTHKDLEDIIKNICKELVVNHAVIDSSIYYDLMERTKRLNNRVELLNFALKKSDSIVIYGSPNWKDWSSYSKYYKYFVDCHKDINAIHQSSVINLHDGVSFHFRSIDCMASGGTVFWYDNRVVEGRGLHDFFDNQWHFYRFKKYSFNEVYDDFKRANGFRNKAQEEMINIIKSHHTWSHRVNKIVKDINSL